jgi:hypothetical protein
MRGISRALVTLALLGCDPTGVDVDTVRLTLRMKLAGDHNVGPSPGRIHVYAESVAVARAWAFPDFGDVCVLETTPVTVCTFDVPRYQQVSLIAAEPDPAIFVRFAPASASDTVRDGRFVEFTGWTECPDRAERGVCVFKARTDVTIEGNFQLLQQVSVYQTGAARMDYVTFSPGPPLKVPAENYNILDYAGCRRVHTYAGAPCDSVRLVGDVPHHRFTAYVGRQTIVGMFPVAGAETEFVRWEGNCIESATYLRACSLITPNVSGAPIRLTVRYTWWSCASGPSERNTGGCVLRD